MPPEDNAQTRYFETVPYRERLLLLGHLVRNADEPLYLRGPAGSGKSVMARRLAATVGDELRVLGVDLAASSDLIGQVAAQLRAPAGDDAALQRAVDGAVSAGGLLLILDKADEIAVATLPMISHLRERGARLLFVGHGGLGAADREIDCQFIDLPAFDAPQTAEFLRHQLGSRADTLSEDDLVRLHRASKGRPGPLLEALATSSAAAESAEAKAEPGPETPSSSTARRWLQWVAGVVAAVVLIGALWFQDTINRWFEPVDTAPQAAATAPPVDAPVAAKSVIVPLEEAEGGDASPVAAITEPDVAAEALSATPESAAVPATPESVSGPVIELPEISARAPAADSEAPAPAVSEDVDPLEAVMRDAQAAAGSFEESSTPPSDALSKEPTATTAGANDVGSETEASASLPVEAATEAATEAVVSAGDSTDQAEGVTPPAAVVEQEFPSAAQDPASAEAPVIARAGDVDPAVVDAAPAAPAAVVERTVTAPAVEAVPVVDVEAVESDPEAPAPVEDRTPDVPSVATPASSPREVSPTADTDGGAGWLSSRNPARYTLQLIGARDRAAVQAFIEGSGLSPPYAIFARNLGGRPWYSLVAGDYPNREAAVAAKSRLPAGVRSADVWPRTFASIPKN